MATCHGSFLEPKPFIARPLRLVVATSDDESSSGAIAVAARLTEQRNAAVLAATVAEPSEHLLCRPRRSGTPIDDEPRYDVPDAIVDALEAVPASKRWTKRAFLGWPADVVNSAAASWDAS